MLNWIWMGMIVVGVVVAALLDQLNGKNGIVEGMFSMVKSGVVDLVIPLSAVMMLWLGIMRLAETSGLIYVVARVVRPVMNRLFPDVPPDHPAMGAMIMNMAANVLGLGNAATPLGLKAMQHLDELNPRKGTATNAMCTFLAINTSSVTLIPATAVGMLAAASVPQPHAIVGTTIVATICSTLVAILTVKLFQGMPIFNRDPDVSDDDESEKSAVPQGGRRFGKWGAVALGLVILLFCGIVYLEMYPEVRVSMQEKLGLREIALSLDAEKPDLHEKEDLADRPAWQMGVMAISLAAIPFVLVFFIVYAALRGVKVYEEFVEGAKEGWAVAVRIMPFLVAMLTALAILRNSGALLLCQNFLRPVLDFLHFPPELLPMALMRPLSGSGSQGVLTEILLNESLGTSIKYMAATMFGSTETTFYVLAVYFGSVAIRRTRHALAAGLCADLAGVIASVVICRTMFG